MTGKVYVCLQRSVNGETKKYHVATFAIPSHHVSVYDASQ